VPSCGDRTLLTNVAELPGRVAFRAAMSVQAALLSPVSPTRRRCVRGPTVSTRAASTASMRIMAEHLRGTEHVPAGRLP
jgi:hypothetical protein